MKYRQWFLLALSPLLLVVALVGVRSFGGSGGVASVHAGTSPHLEIDLVNNGTGWCDPLHIDAAADRIVDPSTEYQVAICATDFPGSPAAFEFEVVYDNTLNTCDNVDCPPGECLDDNPDANGGGSGTTFSSPNLGTGWDCDINNLRDPDPPSQPTCNHGGSMGRAWIACMCTASNCATLPSGNGVSAPLAVLNLKAVADGVDHMKIENAAAGTSLVTYITRCNLPANACVGATETKTEAPTATPVPPTSTPLPPTSTPTITPTPQYPSYCDISIYNGPLTASATTLNMKVGQPPAVVTVTNMWHNYGANPPALSQTCQFARVMGAQLQVTDFTVFAAVPAGLGVRMEPEGLPAAQDYGDVCIACTSTQVGKSVGDCLDPYLGAHGPFDPQCATHNYNTLCSMNPGDVNYTAACCNPLQFTYTPISCDEQGMGSPFPYSLYNHSCENGIDESPNVGVCDWGGFSKLCATPTAPDPNCKDVQAIGLHPNVRAILAPNASLSQTREVKIECRAPGIYPLVIYSAVGQQTDMYPGGSNLGATDPAPANDRSYVLINVLCEPEMLKDCDTVAEGIQTSCVLWLMNPHFPGGVEFGTSPPVTLPAADANGCVLSAQGKGCLAVNVWVKNAQDWDNTNDSDLIPECLGAWEHQVRYDHKILRFLDNLCPKTIDTNQDTIADKCWLESLGRIANCTYSVLGEDWILEGCVTKDNNAVAGMQLGPCGDGIIEQMVIIPQTQDLMYRSAFRPTKNNGVVTNIVDDNCEITDIYGEPMADTLPGQLVPICGNLSITVRMLEGDTDLDCDVDVVDDQALAFRYGASFGMQMYDQWYDLEGPNLSIPDGDIDIKDLQFVFGRNYSTCQTPRPDDQSIPFDPGQP
jgi:hypothetical protein